MRRHLWWVLALALVGGGVALALTTPADPAGFGWFAYTPLSGESDWRTAWDAVDTAGGGSAWLLSQGQLVGAALVALGLVVIGSGVGYRLGRRRAGSAPPTTS